jgi:glycerol dehydrogenase
MLRAFGSPHRYVQGPGALAEVGRLAEGFGRKPLVIADPMVLRLLRDRLEEGLMAHFASVEFAAFGGECTADEIHRLSTVSLACGADFIIGVGGGKAIDTAKGVCIGRRMPLVIVPTIASNDSPTSRIAVVYTSEHVLQEVRSLIANPDLVLVDTEVLVQAPERYFVSGVGDALSKKFEAAQCFASGGRNFYAASPPFVAQTIADACYEVIRGSAESALEAVRARAPNESFERTVEATILLSGLAFENGGLSIAHSLTRGFSVVPGVAQSLHGEQVAFGLLVQLVLEKRPVSFIDELVAFYGRMGLPRSLNELGLKEDPVAAAQIIAHDTWTRAPYVKALTEEVDPARIEAAILVAHRWTG